MIWSGKSSKARHAARRTLSALLSVEVAIAVTLASMTAGARLASFEAYDVLSGSMEPSIHAGSLAYVQTSAACKRIQAGDVIAFDIGEGKTVTHRVQDVDTASHTFVTKGDANETADPHPVAWDAVRGKVVATIPHLGNIIGAFASQKERIVAALAVANALACIALHFLTNAENHSKRGERTWHRDVIRRV